jgi:hypothetical protein
MTLPDHCRDKLPPAFVAKVRVNVETGCWEWAASLNMGGYGQYVLRRRHYVAHRFSYEQLAGPIPKGLHLDHLCRVRHCVNPEHLEPVPQRINTLRGIGFAAQNYRKTHCVNGHEYNAENTYWRREGWRMCRPCSREADRRSWRARSAKNVA